MITMDEIHITIRAPRGPPEAEQDQIVRLVRHRSFLSRLTLTVRRVVRRNPAFRNVRITLSR